MRNAFVNFRQTKIKIILRRKINDRRPGVPSVQKEVCSVPSLKAIRVCGSNTHGHRAGVDAGLGINDAKPLLREWRQISFMAHTRYLCQRDRAEPRTCRYFNPEQVVRLFRSKNFRFAFQSQDFFMLLRVAHSGYRNELE